MTRLSCEHEWAATGAVRGVDLRRLPQELLHGAEVATCPWRAGRGGQGSWTVGMVEVVDDGQIQHILNALSLPENGTTT